jgi:transposase
MNDIKLINIKELAYRWGKDEGTIRRYIKDGVISPCTGVPGIMFHPEIIEKLEGVNIDPMSPIERRNLINQIELLKKQNESLRKVLGNILSESSKVISLVSDLKE